MITPNSMHDFSSIWHLISVTLHQISVHNIIFWKKSWCHQDPCLTAGRTFFYRENIPTSNVLIFLFITRWEARLHNKMRSGGAQFAQTTVVSHFHLSVCQYSKSLCLYHYASWYAQFLIQTALDLIVTAYNVSAHNHNTAETLLYNMNGNSTANSATPQ